MKILVITKLTGGETVYDLSTTQSLSVCTIGKDNYCNLYFNQFQYRLWDDMQVDVLFNGKWKPVGYAKIIP